MEMQELICINKTKYKPQEEVSLFPLEGKQPDMKLIDSQQLHQTHWMSKQPKIDQVKYNFH